MRPDPVCQFQKQCKCKLRHSIRTVCRNICNHYAVLMCRLHIDHIVAGGKHTYISEVRTGLDHSPVYHRLVRCYDLRIAYP